MIEVNVSEYIQVAHRLTKLPGKCHQIHGHSMFVTLYLEGTHGVDGYVLDRNNAILDFSEVKKVFREYLNTKYDHHLLLNEDDPWAGYLYPEDLSREGLQQLPGLIKCDGDPSVENISKWIYTAMRDRFGSSVSRVAVEETATNGVSYPV